MVKTAGKQLSWLSLVGMSFAAGLQLEGCKSEVTDSADTAAGGVSTSLVAELLSTVGPQVILPELQEFKNRLGLLASSLDNWDSAISSQGDVEEAHAAVQDAWRSSMQSWQRLEVMQIGSLGSSLNAIGGEDLRDEIYSWPTVNHCRIDQKTASLQWQETDFFEANLVNAYGLDALEHLVFAGPDSVCNPAVPPLSDGSWDALGPDGVGVARAGYSSRIVEQIEAITDDLIWTWQTDGGGFSDTLKADSEDSIYGSTQEALNAVYDALFYVETRTKDRKLALPLGLRPDECDDDVCPDDLEGLISGETIPMLIANLEGFQALFTGGDGIGFDDLISDLGHDDLTQSMLSHIDGAIAAFEGFEGSIYDAISAQESAPQELFDTLSLLTAEIKWDMSTLLSLVVPEEAKLDND